VIVVHHTQNQRYIHVVTSVVINMIVKKNQKQARVDTLKFVIVVKKEFAQKFVCVVMILILWIRT
jgi:hypothetical protein